MYEVMHTMVNDQPLQTPPEQLSSTQTRWHGAEKDAHTTAEKTSEAHAFVH
jgi:hypothetical protein